MTTQEFGEFCAQLENASVNNFLWVDDVRRGRAVPDNAILIGCGRLTHPSSALVLDNKGSALSLKLKEDYKSITRLMVEIESLKSLTQLPLWNRIQTDPQKLLDTATVVAEDASPDSVWALLVLLARVAGCSPKGISEDWISAIERWESEGLVDDASTGWPGLASALAHAHYPNGDTRKASSEEGAAAWTSMIRFAAGCVARGLRPTQIPIDGNWNLLQDARATLRQEHQAYDDILSHALIVQLCIPLDLQKIERSLLVDAIIFEEPQAGGTVKIFYRNDQTNAPLKQGFTLGAHYRPGESGTGNDFTIAVDPRKRVHLLDLWEELERLECAAWDQAKKPRPCDEEHRRQDMDQTIGRKNPWVEPWYISRDRTLVAAPRRGAEEPHLDWRKVKQAIWKVYNPLNDVRVHPYETKASDWAPELVSLFGLEPEERPPKSSSSNATAACGAVVNKGSEKSPKRLLLADWPRESLRAGQVSPRSLHEAPVVNAVLAALVDREPGQEISIDLLAEPRSWERIKLDAGFAIVTGRGAFVLDDWHPSPRLTPEEILKTFESANDLDSRLTDLEKAIRILAARLEKGLTDNRGLGPFLEHRAKKVALRLKRRPIVKNLLWRTPKWREEKGMVAEAAAHAVKLAELRAQTLSVSPDSDVRHVAEALDRRWALTSRLNLLEEQTKTIRDSVKELGDARGRRIIRFVGLYGFPFYVAEGLAEHLADPIAKHWPILASGDKASPPLWWVCFLIMGVISVLVLNLFVGRDTPKVESKKRN
jgi:hypothetical protein